LEGEKTNQTEHARFELVFGLVPIQKLEKKNFVWLFILAQNQTKLKMLTPSKR
jgi:hypothetical protein